MPRRLAWTDDQLAAAVEASSSWREVAAAVGHARGSTHRVKRRAEELGLDSSHMVGNRRWGASELEAAVASGTTWVDVTRLLGTVPSNVNRVRGAAFRYGLRTDHLERSATSDLPDRARPDMSRLPLAAESLAAAWFALTGQIVSLPSPGSPFDLLVTDGASHRRVQVKTTTHRDPQGNWVVVVARRPYRSERRGGREPYDYRQVDDFFIVNGAGECFLIPVSVIAGRISIVLANYGQHRLGSFGHLFESAPEQLSEPGEPRL